MDALRWMGFTSLAYALGFLGGFAAGHVVLGNVMIWLAVGAAVGLAQARLLDAPVWRWVGANMLGMAVAFGLYAALAWGVEGLPFDLGWPGVLLHAVALGLGGGLAGVLQMRWLRPAAPAWPGIAALGWTASAIGLGIPPSMVAPEGGLGIVAMILRNGLLAPAVAGIVLGGVLWALHVRPRSG